MSSAALEAVTTQVPLAAVIVIVEPKTVQAVEIPTEYVMAPDPEELAVTVWVSPKAFA